MQHDPTMRAAARAVFETVYPSNEWTPVSFEEAERFGTIHYRQALEAAAQVGTNLACDPRRQLALL
ncbi:hypothetical protein Q4F19_04160 [Sphingomonas sp. BIUV-7]|uniref:Uncharacterized protein n=1 Tax=Sphingomonas natans TaxID=3063330 RepID=A0ABT8Y5G9_9SPHN|nr:hypothetical protein [Sphingomonas sp. BIUV-7]MDO6413569.1 hypothetical protein [Sphingomonas sp. BIUV-7]